MITGVRGAIIIHNFFSQFHWITYPKVFLNNITLVKIQNLNFEKCFTLHRRHNTF